MSSVILAPEDYTFATTAEALDHIFSTPHAPDGNPNAWLDPQARTLWIDSRKYFGARVEYARELDLRFLAWFMSPEQDRFYGDPDDARADALEAWAVQLTDEHFGSPYVGALESQYAESLLHHAAGGQFFHHDDVTYVALWSWHMGEARRCSRPMVFQVTCDPAGLLDEDRAEISCFDCEAAWDVDKGEVRLAGVAGEEADPSEPGALYDFAAEGKCPRCGGTLTADMLAATL